MFRGYYPPSWLHALTISAAVISGLFAMLGLVLWIKSGFANKDALVCLIACGVSSAGLFTLDAIYRKYHNEAVKEALKEEDEENWAERIGSESDRRS
jgi:hypothetical protein